MATSASPKLVALLGITGRRVQVDFPSNFGFQKKSKALIINVKTAGDWLKIKRQEKNLTPGHLALKMGIAASLVCSWESDSGKPDAHQMKILAAVLGFTPKDFETQSNWSP